LEKLKIIFKMSDTISPYLYDVQVDENYPIPYGRSVSVGKDGIIHNHGRRNGNSVLEIGIRSGRPFVKNLSDFARVCVVRNGERIVAPPRCWPLEVRDEIELSVRGCKDLFYRYCRGKTKTEVVMDATNDFVEKTTEQTKQVLPSIVSLIA